MARQKMLPITTREKDLERLFFRQPIPPGTVLRLRKPDAPNMRKWDAIYVGCGINYATGRFGVPVRMHWIKSSDPRGQNRTIEDRSLWLIYDVSPWCHPEWCGPDPETEQALLSVFVEGHATQQKETKPMSLPKFHIATHVPPNTILQPRAGANRKAVLYVRAVETNPGTHVFIVRTRVSEDPERWGQDRAVTYGALIHGYDLTPFGYLTLDVRSAASRSEKAKTIKSLEARIAELTERLNRMEGKE